MEWEDFEFFRKTLPQIWFPGPISELALRCTTGADVHAIPETSYTAVLRNLQLIDETGVPRKDTLKFITCCGWIGGMRNNWVNHKIRIVEEQPIMEVRV